MKVLSSTRKQSWETRRKILFLLQMQVSIPSAPLTEIFICLHLGRWKKQHGCCGSFLPLIPPTQPQCARYFTSVNTSTNWEV